MGIAACWLLTEWLRSLGPFGYPWGLLAATQVAFLPLVQPAAWFGSFGLSALLAFVNALFFLSWRLRRARFAIAAVVALTVFSVTGWLDMKRIEQLARAAPQLTVAVVQGNFGKERWRRDVTFSELEAIVRTHLQMSQQAAQQGAKLIVWSETALPWSLRENGHWGYKADELQAFAERFQVALFVGAGEWQDGKSYNACFVFAPKGVRQGADVAHKRRLVPFGEYVPGRNLFPWLTRFIPHAPIETTPGDKVASILLRLNGKAVKPAVVVCFESLFPFHLRQLVNTIAANLLVIITNDSWFGPTLAPFHHARIAVLRAVETRRAIARGAGTGISLIIAPTGRVLQVANWDERRTLLATVPLLEVSTPYLLLGELPLVLLSVVVLLVALRCQPSREQKETK